MSIFINNIKRIIRDKGNIINMILTPLIFIMFIMGNGNINKLNAAVIDKDNTSLSKMIVNMINSNVNLKDIKEEEINEKLLNEQIDYALVIDKGFTEKIIKGEDVKLRGYKIKETNISVPINIYINSF
ncbi:MAG TPA: ABC transporter permease, partial [Clostridiaceae bacterium]|nr:ABC transporter permease [Clostridiaceae bacterium]